MQLSARIKARELEDFFSVVGKVSDVRIITDAKTRRSKGIAYVEFEDVESVPLALGLGGQKLLGVPIVVQPTLAERNRAANLNNPDHGTKPGSGPMRLYVGSLHFNITEEMLRGIFEPFGKIDVIQLIMDSETGRSKGYGFVTVSLPFWFYDEFKTCLVLSLLIYLLCLEMRASRHPGMHIAIDS